MFLAGQCFAQTVLIILNGCARGISEAQQAHWSRAHLMHLEGCPRTMEGLLIATQDACRKVLDPKSKSLLHACHERTLNCCTSTIDHKVADEDTNDAKIHAACSEP